MFLKNWPNFMIWKIEGLNYNFYEAKLVDYDVSNFNMTWQFFKFLLASWLGGILTPLTNQHFKVFHFIFN